MRFRPAYLKYFFVILLAAILADGFRPPESQLVSRGLAELIGLYQRVASPLLHMGGRLQMCRFHPTCSEYARQSLIKHGLYKGLAKGTWRILRCNPWNEGGIDNP